MKRLSYNQVKQAFEVEGYTLVSKEYVNQQTKLELICPNKHIYKISWKNWKTGQRCRCRTVFGNITTIEKIKHLFQVENYILLTKKYKNAHNYLKFICPKGHHHKIKYSDWTQGHRCGVCDKKHITYNEVKQSFEDNDYQLISIKYINKYSYLEFICPNGHRHKIRWNDWQQGQRCGKCSNNISKPEKEILHHVMENYSGVVKPNDRTLMRSPKDYPLELDIWMPEIKKAIEYGADYYHSDEYKKICDDYKIQWCRENGIELLVINHKDWIKNRDFEVIDNFINS